MRGQCYNRAAQNQVYKAFNCQKPYMIEFSATMRTDKKCQSRGFSKTVAR